MNAALGNVLRHVRTLAARELADRELVERFAGNGDEGAFAELMRRHGPLVLAVCRRVLGHEHDAEDAFQATFLVLARKAASIRKGNTVANWLYGVAYRIAMKAKTSLARRRLRERRAKQPEASGPAYDAAWHDLQRVLDEELNRLPEKYRAVFVLCCLEGKSKSEAARELGWKVGTVSSRLAGARKQLQERLSRRGLTLTAALVAADVSAATASVPAGLAASSLKAALAFASRQAVAASLSSAKAILLAETMLRSMALAPLKIASIFLAVSCLVTAGAGLVQPAPAAKEPEPPAQQAQKNEPQRTAAQKPAEQKRMLTDRYGDPLPERAVARLGSTRLRHGFTTFAVAFSPDGKTLASTGGGRGICWWDAATGKELYHVEQARDAYALAISPDGKLLASAYERNKVCLWDIATGSKVRQLPCGGGFLTKAIAFSPDGKTLACGDSDKVIRLCDVASGQVLGQLRGHEKDIRTVAFSPDGKTLASGSEDMTVRLWDLATGRETARFKGHKMVYRVVFFPDGKTLASAGHTDVVRLWDVAARKETRTLDADRVMLNALAVSADGTFLVTGHNDGLIRVWDSATGKERRRWRGHFAGVSALAISADGNTLASGSFRDSTLRLWDPATGKERLPLGGVRNAINQLEFSPDGKEIIVSSWDRSLYRWDWAADRERSLLSWPLPISLRHRVSPDQKTLVAHDYRNHAIYVWRDPAKTEPRVLGEHPGEGVALVFSHDGSVLASGGTDPWIRLWDMRAGKELRRIKADQKISSLAFSPDGKTRASGTQTTMAPADPTLRLWDVATGKSVRSFEQGWVHQLVFSPNGKLLANSGGVREYRPRLLDLARGKEVTLPQPGGEVECSAIAISPDSRFLAWGAYRENKIRVVELATRQEVTNFEGHHSGIAQLCFSPDGRLLGSAGYDSTVLLWDLSGRMRNRQWQPARLTAAHLEAPWTELGGEASKGYRAAWLLTADPANALPLLRQRLRPAKLADSQRVAKLIAGFDSDKFEVREETARALAKLGEAAEPTLRQALKERISLETRRRIEQLLARLDSHASPELIRSLRAAAVLERIGTQNAVDLLTSLAKGAPNSRLAQEACASLERLAKRRRAE